jgi:hypothetical protein
MNVLALAKECVQLEAFVHVSTAYVNSHFPHRARVEEKLYDLPIDVNEFYATLLRGDDVSAFRERMAVRLARSLCTSHACFVCSSTSLTTAVLPGSALAQYLYDVQSDRRETAHCKCAVAVRCAISSAVTSVSICVAQLHRGKVPLALVRPTLVTCTMKEPHNWIGTVLFCLLHSRALLQVLLVVCECLGSLGAGGGIFLGMGTGVIKVFSGVADGTGDFTPVDYCTNVMMTAAAGARHANLRMCSSVSLTRFCRLVVAFLLSVCVV